MSKKYYFIGMGGISMSSLAAFLKLNGNEVAGSDLTRSEQLDSLSDFNIAFFIGHKRENIENFNPNFVVINFAISSENEELAWAIKNNKKIINRSDLLNKISRKFKNIIAVAGTHGKTTTTALISEIFIDAGLKPTVHIGGILRKNNSNFLIGDKKYFITEACEYKNSFLSLRPQLGITLNIEPDHLDFFKNVDMLEDSFKKFQANSKANLIHQNKYQFILSNTTTNITYKASNIRRTKQGYNFDLWENSKKIATFQTNYLGEHNIENSIAAIATALYYKIPIKSIKRSIKSYHGVKRRFEKIGKLNSSLIVHDYAHHPTAIKKVIAEAKEYGRILTVFQPHTYSRTKALYDEFLKCFNLTDGLILLRTYSARESEDMGNTAYDLFSSLELKANVFNYLDYANELNEAKKKILLKLNNYDCILILGAGDINLLVKSLF